MMITSNEHLGYKFLGVVGAQISMGTWRRDTVPHITKNLAMPSGCMCIPVLMAAGLGRLTWKKAAGHSPLATSAGDCCSSAAPFPLEPAGIAGIPSDAAACHEGELYNKNPRDAAVYSALQIRMQWHVGCRVLIGQTCTARAEAHQACSCCAGHCCQESSLHGAWPGSCHCVGLGRRTGQQERLRLRLQSRFCNLLYHRHWAAAELCSACEST